MITLLIKEREEKETTLNMPFYSMVMKEIRFGLYWYVV